MLKRLIVLVCLALAVPLAAQDRAFSLSAPAVLRDSGLLAHLLPRFSLKHGVRVEVVDGAADAQLGDAGTPVFRRGEVIWHLGAGGSVAVESFRDWLVSDVGKRTIEAFAPRDGRPFSARIAATGATQEVLPEGDAVLGEVLSLEKCGRCHVINESNRMKAIGSTPSFALMRNFGDWQERFETFFLLNPHPAFTQVADMTDAFAEHLPPPIAPVMLTWEEIVAITAYVGLMAPADLGAPIQSR